MFIVVHTSPDGPGLLAAVLDRATPLKVVSPDEGMLIRDGYVYVAPPDYHLTIRGGRVRLTRGPREHRFRPAIDPLFRTAAEHFGARTFGVILSGHMADGTHGLAVIKQAGGVTVVQDPDEAEAPSMPRSAMRQVGVDYVLPVEEMGRVIMGLLMSRRKGHTRTSSPAGLVRAERPRPERPGTDALRTGAFDGPPSPFTCPDCGGTLWEITDAGLVRYRCHVGHGFTADSLRDGMDEKLEDTLWSALRAIEELIELRSRMRARAKSQRLTAFASTFDEEIAGLTRRAEALRRLLLHPGEQAAPDTKRVRNRHAHG